MYRTRGVPSLGCAAASATAGEDCSPQFLPLHAAGPAGWAGCVGCLLLPPLLLPLVVGQLPSHQAHPKVQTTAPVPPPTAAAEPPLLPAPPPPPRRLLPRPPPLLLPRPPHPPLRQMQALSRKAPPNSFRQAPTLAAIGERGKTEWPLEGGRQLEEHHRARPAMPTRPPRHAGQPVLGQDQPGACFRAFQPIPHPCPASGCPPEARVES